MTFFNMKGPATQSSLAAWDDTAMRFEVLKCHENPDHIRTGRRLTPLHVTLPSSTVQEFVWTWYGDCLLTDRVVTLFADLGVTGFVLQPVFVTGVHVGRLSDVPRLREMVVTGWAGMAAEESGICVEADYPCCGHKTYSAASHPEHLIDTGRWDKSDIFTVWPLPVQKFCTDRIAKIIQDNTLTGVRLVTLDQLDLSGGFAPGRLVDWFPAALVAGRQFDTAVTDIGDR